MQPDDYFGGPVEGHFDMLVVVSEPPEDERVVAIVGWLVGAGLSPGDAEKVAAGFPPAPLDVVESAIRTARRITTDTAGLVAAMGTLLRPHGHR